MRLHFGFAAFVSISLASTFAAASDLDPTKPKTGIEIGARVGFGVPLGDLQPNQAMTDTHSSTLPLWVDAGYRIHPTLFVGGYFVYAPTALSKSMRAECPTSCNADNVRFGLQAHFHPFPGARVDPWIGLGFGWDILTTRARSETSSTRIVEQGFEILNIQLGGDVRLTDVVSVGPFASLSYGQYIGLEATSVGYGRGRDFYLTAGRGSEATVHSWLVFGVRGSFTR